MAGGYRALCDGSLVPSALGDEVQAAPPTTVTSGAVVCVATWGFEGAAPVTLALNGAAFVFEFATRFLT